MPTKRKTPAKGPPKRRESVAGTATATMSLSGYYTQEAKAAKWDELCQMAGVPTDSTVTDLLQAQVTADKAVKSCTQDEVWSKNWQGLCEELKLSPSGSYDRVISDFRSHKSYATKWQYVCNHYLAYCSWPAEVFINHVIDKERFKYRVDFGHAMAWKKLCQNNALDRDTDPKDAAYAIINTAAQIREKEPDTFWGDLTSALFGVPRDNKSTYSVCPDSRRVVLSRIGGLCSLERNYSEICEWLKLPVNSSPLAIRTAINTLIGASSDETRFVVFSLPMELDGKKHLMQLRMVAAVDLKKEK